jgi:hypothetical protein
MSGEILAGPFLTRSEVAERLGVSGLDVAGRHDLLRIGGRFREEVYFEFQLAGNEVRRDVGRIVLAMKGRCTDAQIADWLVRPNNELKGISPLRWLDSMRSEGRLLRLAEQRALAEPATPVATPAAIVRGSRPARRSPVRKPLLHFPRHAPAH